MTRTLERSTGEQNSVRVRQGVKLRLQSALTKRLLRFLNIWQTVLRHPFEITSFYRANHPGHRMGASVDVILHTPAFDRQRRDAMKFATGRMTPYYSRPRLWQQLRDSLAAIGKQALALGVARVAVEADHFHIDLIEAFSEFPGKQERTAKMLRLIGRPLLARWSPGVDNVLVRTGPVIPKLRQETDTLERALFKKG